MQEFKQNSPTKFVPLGSSTLKLSTFLLVSWGLVDTAAMRATAISSFDDMAPATAEALRPGGPILCGKRECGLVGCFV